MSTKGRYGVRLMLDLAIHSADKPILLKDISKRQGISEKYLWQLMSPLKNAGLVKSVRGPHGGYQLAKKLNEITLKDIVYILEGSLLIVDCLEGRAVCDKSNDCITRDIWMDISMNLIETLKSINLEDMLEKYKVKSKTLSFAI